MSGWPFVKLEPMAKRIASLKVAALRTADYDFRTKMKINLLVIEELKRESGLADENEVAVAIAESPIHGEIQKLADAIHEEAKKIKPADGA